MLALVHVPGAVAHPAQRALTEYFAAVHDTTARAAMPIACHADRQSLTARLPTLSPSGVHPPAVYVLECALKLAHNILTGSTDTASGFAKLYKERMAQKSACNRLSITQQVAAGLV